MAAYPVSRANLSVATSAAGERGDLGDWDALLILTHPAAPTLCPIQY